MNLLRRAVLAGVFFVALTALSFPTKLKSPVSRPAAQFYEFSDLRDPKLFKSGSESLLVTNCAYGAYRIGQRDIDPDFALLIAAMLTERFGERLTGMRVSLLAASMHLNSARSLRESMGRAYTGLIPSLLNDVKKVGCAEDDNRGGYRSDEVLEHASPLIVAIDLKINDQSFRARSVVAFPFQYPPVKWAKPEDKERWNKAADTAVAEAIARLGDQIEQRLFVAASTSQLPAESDSAPALQAPAVEKPMVAEPTVPPAPR